MYDQLITHPPEPGQYDVVNQMSGFYSINHLAHTVAKVASKEFAIPVVIQRVENPRVEADIHPFEPIYNKLPDQFGFKPRVTLEDEIYCMLGLLTQPHIKERIEEKKHLILPRTSERFINSLTNFKVKVVDSGTGFRALKRELASKLNLKGKCTCGILVLEANRHGARIVEVPITLNHTLEKRNIAWSHFWQIFYVLP